MDDQTIPNGEDASKASNAARARLSAFANAPQSCIDQLMWKEVEKLTLMADVFHYVSKSFELQKKEEYEYGDVEHMLETLGHVISEAHEIADQLGRYLAINGHVEDLKHVNPDL